MMLGRINEGGILVQEQFPRLGVYRVWASAELKGEGKKGEREIEGKEGRSRGREGEVQVSLYDQRCGSRVDRYILLFRARVDRLDLLRLCLFMPALSFIFAPPLFRSLSYVAYVWPLQMNGITLSVSRGEGGCKEEILRRYDESAEKRFPG